MSLGEDGRRGLRLKRLLRVLPTAVRDVLLTGLPRGWMDRDFVLRRLPAGSVGAEIGVHEGDFSRRILHLAKPKRLHLIDPWKYEESEVYARSLYGGRLGVDQEHMDRRYEDVRRRFRREMEAGEVDVCRQRSADACATFADDYFDWIYIDGNHLYEHVTSDLERFHGKVKPGGLISGDDYGDGQWWNGGVKRAVDDFVAKGKGELLEIRNRQFVLRRPSRPA